MAKIAEVEMELDKETKRTYMYRATVDGASVDTLYVSKRAFSGDAPKNIKVVVETGD